ncbi:MAG: TetR/AcrR family transcriptional regulator [Bacteroidota bacterium]
MENQSKYTSILDSAEEILKQEGLSGISINKVAKKAKIAKGTVYLYFKSKEEIIAAITVKARKLLLQYFHQYCDRQSDPIEKIKAIFYADYHFFKEQYTYHELVSFYEQNTGLMEDGALAETSHEISAYIKNLLEEAKKVGAIRQDVDCMKTTFLFWGMVIGILQLIENKKQQIQHMAQTTESDFFDSYVDFMIQGLK